MSGFEDVHVHRFTDDGRYLICFSRNQHDLVVYRFKGFGAADESVADEPGRAAGPATPSAGEGEGEGPGWGPSGGAASAPSARGGSPRVAQPATSRDRYFDLLYTRPLTVDADLLARDFAVTILDGAYLLVASSTPAEAPPRDRGAGERTAADAAAELGRTRDGAGAAAAATAAGGGGGGGGASPSGSAAPPTAGAAAASARASGAAAVARARAEAEADTAARRGAGRPNATTTLPGSPTMDTVALHLVRLRDGRVCDRRVYRDDYVRLRRAAAVSVFAETASSCLVSVLSLRWQAFRVLRVSLQLDAPAPADGAARTEPAGSSEPAGSDPSRAVPGPRTDANAKPVDTSEDLIAVFADARTPVGSACAPDDDAPLAAQDRAEREWRLAARAFRPDDDAFFPDDADAFALTPSEPSGDDDAGGGTRGGGRAPGATGGIPGSRRASAVRRARGPGDPRGWSDPESHMYAGIKQKLMTRVLLEARRRDAAEAEAEAREKAEAEADACVSPGRNDPSSSSSSRRRGVKRDAASAFVPSVSAPPTESERLAAETWAKRRTSFSGKAAPKAPPSRRATRRGAFVSAFFSRYWSYAEWMVLWHVQLLDERRALLRFGTAEDVLAWGTRRSRAEAGAHPGSERCPETVLVAVMDWVEGTVAHVGDAAGAGGGLLGVPGPPERSGGSGTAEVTEGGVPGEPAPPQAQGSVWQRLAAGAGGVGGRAPAFGGGFRDAAVADAEPSDPRFVCRSNPNPAGLEPGFRWPARPSSQGHWSPSPYFDTRLFRYDERAAAPDERPRPAPDVSLRFSAAPRRVRRVENARGASSRNAALRGAFEEPEERERGRSEERRAPENPKTAPTNGEAEARRTARGARFAFSPSRVVATGARARVKRTVTHVFHPVYPFAMSVSQAFMQPQVVSFHLRWDGAAE